MCLPAVSRHVEHGGIISSLVGLFTVRRCSLDGEYHRVERALQGMEGIRNKTPRLAGVGAFCSYPEGACLLSGVYHATSVLSSATSASISARSVCARDGAGAGGVTGAAPRSSHTHDHGPLASHCSRLIV